MGAIIKSVIAYCAKRRMQESDKMSTEGVILSGVLERTRLYLDGSLENPLKGAEGVSRQEFVCESLRQKDSEI